MSYAYHEHPIFKHYSQSTTILKELKKVYLGKMFLLHVQQFSTPQFPSGFFKINVMQNPLNLMSFIAITSFQMAGLALNWLNYIIKNLH